VVEGGVSESRASESGSSSSKRSRGKRVWSRLFVVEVLKGRRAREGTSRCTRVKVVQVKVVQV
jgi:hypothetical protein